MRIELFYYEQCPFCRLVLNKINQLNLEDKIVFKNTLSDPQFRKEHREKTGRSTVPCLYIDGKPLFESQDICKWLEENGKSL